MSPDDHIDDYIRDATRTAREHVDGFADFREQADKERWGFTGISVHRDSPCVDRSNWRCIVAKADQLYAGLFYTMHTGCSMVGWIDHLMVDVTSREAVNWIMDVEDGLDDYPLFDENDFSDLEVEERTNWYCSDIESGLLTKLEERLDPDEWEFTDAERTVIQAYLDEVSGPERGTTLSDAWVVFEQEFDEPAEDFHIELSDDNVERFVNYLLHVRPQRELELAGQLRLTP